MVSNIHKTISCDYFIFQVLFSRWPGTIYVTLINDKTLNAVLQNIMHRIRTEVL